MSHYFSSLVLQMYNITLRDVRGVQEMTCERSEIMMDVGVIIIMIYIIRSLFCCINVETGIILFLYVECLFVLVASGGSLKIVITVLI